MREIKFRAWNGFRQEMNKVLNIGWLDGIYMNISVDTEKGQINYSDSPDNMECENIELMQYTGLKDKNGKEIYEGDILTGRDYPFIDEEKQNYVGIVEYYEDIALFGYTYQCVNKNKRGISNGFNNGFEANENLVCEDLEVIGNIYENPELLEE